MKNFLSLPIGFSLLLATNSIWASANLAPNNFPLRDRSSQAVYIDLKHARYEISVDLDRKKVHAKSTLTFDQNAPGFPLFDLLNSATQIFIDGKPTKMVTLQDPDKATWLRSIESEISAGEHVLQIEHDIEQGVKWEGGQVSLGFFMSDLNDRQYLEQYLPTSFEYDSYQADISISGLPSETYALYSNNISGTKNGDNYELVFPAYFTTSSFYLHLLPKTDLETISFNQIEEDGRSIPVTIYSKFNKGKNLQAFADQTKKVLSELEKTYGPFPHAKVVIYGVGPMYGGMEHCGATITSYYALGHELTHSYFARGIMPANGNTGWIDEAMASWRDSGYKTLTSISFSPTNMGAHSPYSRYTDRRAYSDGRDFLAYLHSKLSKSGGLKSVMGKFHSQKTRNAFDQKELVEFINLESGEDFSSLFQRYIWADSPKGKLIDQDSHPLENPMHPRLTEQMKQDLL